MTTYATLKINGESGELTGNLTTLTFVKQLRFVPVTKKGEAMPAYRIMCNDVEIGAAWEKAARSSGQVYHSVKLDSPELLAPMHLAMFPAKDRAGFYELTWNRQKRREPGEQADPADDYGSQG